MRTILKWFKNEAGQSIILIAISAVVLCGVAALVIDLGMVYVSKGQLQTAADAAALAAAHDLPSATVAKSTAVEYAGYNGVAAADTTATTPYNGNANQIEVVCKETVSYTFARVLGLNSTVVTARAVAERSGGGLGAAFDYAIFSGNKYPDSLSFSVKLQNVLVMSGSSNIVNGNIHANYKIDTNTAYVNGVGEAVDTVTGNNITTKMPGAPFIAIPDFSSVVPAIKEAATSAGQYYPGNFSSSNASSLNVSSPVYVEGNANLTGISFSGKGCIYVKGKIKITGSSTNYASNSSICMYSGYTSSYKSDAAIDFSGSDKDFKGILYAPNGSILVTGSGYTFNGSIVGRVVDISGSNKTFKAADASDSFPYSTSISFILVE